MPEDRQLLAMAHALCDDIEDMLVHLLDATDVRLCWEMVDVCEKYEGTYQELPAGRIKSALERARMLIAYMNRRKQCWLRYQEAMYNLGSMPERLDAAETLLTNLADDSDEVTLYIWEFLNTSRNRFTTGILAELVTGLEGLVLLAAEGDTCVEGYLRAILAWHNGFTGSHLQLPDLSQNEIIGGWLTTSAG